MPSTDRISLLAGPLFATGPGAPTLDQKVEIAEVLRGQSPEMSKQIFRTMFSRLDQLSSGLEEARANFKRAAEVLEQISAPPWYVAEFIRMVATGDGAKAMVVCNGRRSLVALHPELVKAEDLACGDEVLLSNQLNVLMCRSPLGPCQFGEAASFARKTDDGRLVLRCRDEEMIVEAAGTLGDCSLKEGDLVRWGRATWLAYEKLASPCDGRKYLLDDVPAVAADQVGGQAASLRALVGGLATTLLNPDRARRYGLTGRGSIILIGPPGCGKTLMARVAVSEISRISGRRCRFGIVRPAEWENPYVGVTEQNIRNCFQTLREAGGDGDPAILFLDEVETIGRIRGGVANLHADRFLGALLAELDGYNGRGNIVIISASNRKDLIDPALLERLGETEIVVGRPDMAGARAIFDIHLPAGVPLNPNHSAVGATRQEVIDTAVSLLYAPNAGNELCVLRFRDNKTRMVYARELVSGRLIEQVCRQACQQAFLKELDGGDAGLTVQDMRDAVASAIRKLSTVLSPRNVHAYLTDLSNDTDVVDIRPIDRKVDRPHRYLTTTVP
jgi:proteasome-associated ATPase